MSLCVWLAHARVAERPAQLILVPLHGSCVGNQSSTSSDTLEMANRNGERWRLCF